MTERYTITIETSLNRWHETYDTYEKADARYSEIQKMYNDNVPLEGASEKLISKMSEIITERRNSGNRYFSRISIEPASLIQSPLKT